MKKQSDEPHTHGGHAHPHAPNGEAHHGEHAHPHTQAAHGVNEPSHQRSPDREPLARGAGQGKILFFDAPSGIAGDMVVAALADLGVPHSVVHEAVEALGLEGCHVHFGWRERSGIVASSFGVHAPGDQPERTYGVIRALLERAPLPASVCARAAATFRRLAEAESRVHRMPIDDVHFHEVGAVDALVDIVASAASLDYLGATLVVSPLPMGHGRVRARHGILPLPAPAVVECLRGFPTYDGAIAFELVTPTGAAIVGAHAARAERWPSMCPERVGWGAGSADLDDRPNVLRAVLGSDHEMRHRAVATHVVVETNLDDATGELLAYCMESLRAEGALDVWAIPMTMKKGRPGFLLGALVTQERKEALAAVMLRESTTLGVRFYDVCRVERPRRMTRVETRFGVISVKIADGPFGPERRKPEFDECAAAARRFGVSVREVLDAAMAAVVAEPSA